MGGAGSGAPSPCARAQSWRLRFPVIRAKLFRLLAALVEHPSGITMKVRSQISQGNLTTLFKVVLNFLCTLRTQNKGNYIWGARGPLSGRFGVSFKPPDLDGKLIWKVF